MMQEQIARLYEKSKKACRNTLATAKGRVTGKPYTLLGRCKTVNMGLDKDTIVQEMHEIRPAVFRSYESKGRPKKKWIRTTYVRLTPSTKKWISSRTSKAPFESF